MPSDLEISRIKAVVPGPNGAVVVVKAEAVLADNRTELEIAITTELAASMALALLATTAEARASRDDLEPALEILAAGVVESSEESRIRLQLLFDKGAVLPVEMPRAAGHALNKGLANELRAPDAPA